MRVLTRPVLALALALGALVAGVAIAAGVVRLLPLALAPNVPAGVGLALARGVIALAFEVGAFVAPPLAAAVVCARLVERGDAGALAALGVRPARLVVSAWPAALVLATIGALASAAWGREAAAPGLLVARLFRDARTTCASAAPPAAVEVPLAGAAWLCLPGEPPRAVVRALAGARTSEVRAALVAREISPSADLRTLRAEDAALYLDGEGGRVVLSADEATVRGLVPLGQASNLGPVVRAALLASTAIALGFVAALAVLRLRVPHRARAIAIGAAGPIGALLVFSALERAPHPGASYAFVPLAGIAACVVVALASARLRRPSLRSTNDR